MLEAALLLIYFLSSGLLDGSVAWVFSGVALFSKLESFSNGILDLTALVQYLSVAGLFVFFAIQAVEKRRWS